MILGSVQALVDALGGLTGSADGETRSNQDALESLQSRLLEQAAELDRAELKRLGLGGGEFGGSPLGLSLGDHHGRAHRVIVETIDGVVADLERFRSSVVRAEELLASADVGSADTMERTRVRVEAEAATLLASATSTSEADQRYDAARNGHANQSRPHIAPADASAGADTTGVT